MSEESLQLWLVYHKLNEQPLCSERTDIMRAWFKPNMENAPTAMFASEALREVEAGPQRLEFQLVAIVAGNSPEEIFTATNHISSQDWRTNPNVKAVVLTKGRLRSTSVGDVLVETSTQQEWRVAGCGFSKLTNFQPIAAPAAVELQTT